MQGAEKHRILDEIVAELNRVYDGKPMYVAFGLYNKLNICHFFSFLQEESGLEMVLEENLNHYPRVLMNLFKNFSKDLNAVMNAYTYGKLNKNKIISAQATFKNTCEKNYNSKVLCEHRDCNFVEVQNFFKNLQPKKANVQQIGNIAYNDRNGNQLQDDGYRYRGRGLIQITGRAKYQEFTDYALKHDWIEASVNFVKTPDIVSTSGTYAILSAIYYWQKNGCDIIAKKDDNSVGTYSYKKNNNKFTGSFNNAVAKISEKINGVSKVNLDNRGNNFEKLYKSQIFNEFP